MSAVTFIERVRAMSAHRDGVRIGLALAHWIAMLVITFTDIIAIQVIQLGNVES